MAAILKSIARIFRRKPVKPKRGQYVVLVLKATKGNAIIVVKRSSYPLTPKGFDDAQHAAWESAIWVHDKLYKTLGESPFNPDELEDYGEDEMLQGICEDALSGKMILNNYAVLIQVDAHATRD